MAAQKRLILAALLILLPIRSVAYHIGKSPRLWAMSQWLTGTVDDFTTDMTLYPQRSALLQDWFFRAEGGPYSRVALQAVKPGPISVGIEAEDYLNFGFSPKVKVPVSFLLGSVPVGATLQPPGIYGTPEPPPDAESLAVTWFNDKLNIPVRVGAMWTGPEWELDVNLWAAYAERAGWTAFRESLWMDWEDKVVVLVPSARLSLNGTTPKVRLQFFLRYQPSWMKDYWMQRRHGEPVDTINSAYLSNTVIVGFVHLVGERVTIAGALISFTGLSIDHPHDSGLHWMGVAPLGLEYRLGPVLLRGGMDVTYRTASGDWRERFAGHPYVGLALEPHERVLLEFTPRLHDDLGFYTCAAAVQVRL